MQDKKPIQSYKDLDVYKNSYMASIRVMKEVLPKLPAIEKFDLADQLRRSVKAIPRLIAEGYAKRHQKHGFQKYLDDALAESNETEVSLQQCKDIYCIECNELLAAYERTGKQIFRLSQVWTTFKLR